MLIDWFTVGAQALNFVILAWLMKRFLYKPILDAIDAREQRIASALAAADRKQSEAEDERAAFQKKNDDFEQQRAALLNTARADADTERRKLLDAARQAADALVAKRQEALASEAQALVQGVRVRTQTEVFAIARRALTDLADVSLEASACAVFITRLRGLEGQPRDALAAALGGSRDAVRVRSAFELPGAERSAIQQAIADTFGVHVELRYDTEPALVGGIELIAQGRKFAWSIDDYLAALERGVSDLLQARTRESEAAPVPAADAAPGTAVQPELARPASEPSTAAVAP